MNLLRVGIALLSFVLATDARYESQISGYPDVPRFLPVYQRADTVTDGTCSTDPFTFDISNNRSPVNIRNNGQILVQSVTFEVAAKDLLNHRSLQTTQVARSYMTRVSGGSDYLSDGRLLASLEQITEAYKGSPRLSLFSRLIFRDNVTLSVTCILEVPANYDSVIVQSSRVIKIFHKGAQLKEMRIDEENSSVNFVSSLANTGFGIYFHSASAEIREWHQDDYTVKRRPSRKLSLSSDPAGNTIATIMIDSIEANLGQTLEQNFTIINFVGGDRKIENYLSPAVLHSYGRYFPREGYSSNWYQPKEGFTGVHLGGYIWGYTTYANVFMRYFLNSPSDSLHHYYWDEMARHFTYFIERQSTYGLLPFTTMPKYLIDQTKDTGKIFSDFMFAQAGVGDIDFAVKLLPTLPKEESDELFLRLSRVKLLFNPSEQMSWTVILPSGAYWFEYSNLWKAEGYFNYIINTHVDALRVAIHMKELSQALNKPEDVLFWGEVVRKGTEGLLWFLEDKKNWTEKADLTRELSYRKWGVPVGKFHQYTLNELQYLIDQGMLQYKKDEIQRTIQSMTSR